MQTKAFYHFQVIYNTATVHKDSQKLNPPLLVNIYLLCMFSFTTLLNVANLLLLDQKELYGAFYMLSVNSSNSNSLTHSSEIGPQVKVLPLIFPSLQIFHALPQLRKRLWSYYSCCSMMGFIYCICGLGCHYGYHLHSMFAYGSSQPPYNAAGYSIKLSPVSG